jgi:uncharacterized membrane protein YidH (DUF202 family)
MLFLLLAIAALACDASTEGVYINSDFIASIAQAETLARQNVQARVKTFLAWAATEIAHVGIGLSNGPQQSFLLDVPQQVRHLIGSELCTIGYALGYEEWSGHVYIYKLEEEGEALQQRCAQNN